MLNKEDTLKINLLGFVLCKPADHVDIHTTSKYTLYTYPRDGQFTLIRRESIHRKMNFLINRESWIPNQSVLDIAKVMGESDAK